LREAFTGDFKRRGLEARLIEVIHRGLASDRFRLLDREVGAIATAAAVVGVVASALGEEPIEPAKGPLRGLAKVARRTAATMLAALGLDPAEARLLAEQPRPARPVGAHDTARSRTSDPGLLFVRSRPKLRIAEPPTDELRPRRRPER
jgi:hypothetical protein